MSETAGLNTRRQRTVRGSSLWLLLALSVALLLSGCGLREQPVTRDPSPSVSARGVVTDRLAVPCEQTITEFSPPGPDLNTVDPDFEIVGGVAALRTAGSDGRVAGVAAHGFYDDPALRLGAKTPVLVRRGSTFELRVPDSFRDRVALDFVHSGPPAFRIAFGPCESDTEWMVFIGYVWVADRECVALEVVLQDSTVETLTLGLGTPCPGKQSQRASSDK